MERKQGFVICLAAITTLVVVALFGISSAFAEDDPSAAPDTTATLDVGESKSGYHDSSELNGGHSVAADLDRDDKVKNSLFGISVAGKNFYKIKKRINDKIGLAVNLDYNYLNQYATYSSSDTQGSSGVFRFYGKWSPWRKSNSSSGLVFRIQNKHLIGTGLTPRKLGFATGSALSTAAWSASGWGISKLFWAQTFRDNRILFTFGQLKATNYVDLFPFLSAWNSFMNDASYHNPSMVQTGSGLGFVLQGYVVDQFYVGGGIHDANGTTKKIDFSSFFNTKEYFSWLEVGWAPASSTGKFHDNISLSVWHVDERVQAGLPEGQGLAFTATKQLLGDWSPFVRAGVSDGNAALVQSMISLGVGSNVRIDDFFGMAFSWASPKEDQGRDQFTWEALYRLQLTDNLEVTPGFQWTFNPARDLDHDSVFVASVVRVRFVL